MLSQIDLIKDDFCKCLPNDIAMARDAYQRLASEAAGIMEAKEFAAHQGACKAALGHLESLIKLLRWACEGAVEPTSNDANNGQINGIDRLIDEARSALSSMSDGAKQKKT